MPSGEREAPIALATAPRRDRPADGHPKACRSDPRSAEVFMSATIDSECRSELLREIDARARAQGKAQGKAEGKVRGMGRAVLIVLDERGVLVPDDVRDQVLACTDLGRLDTWLRRAATTASTAGEVVRPWSAVTAPRWAGPSDGHPKDRRSGTRSVGWAAMGLSRLRRCDVEVMSAARGRARPPACGGATGPGPPFGAGGPWGWLVSRDCRGSASGGSAGRL